MKTTPFFLFVLISASAFSQEKRIDQSKLPAVVINYLKENYPAAKKFEYFQRTENDTLYFEIEFTLTKQEYNLKFSSRGSLLETEREIELEEIPPLIKGNILSVLKDKFKSYQIKKIQELNPIGSRQFELTIKVKKSSQYKAGFYDLLYDSNGILLSIEEEKLHSIESVF